MKRGKKRALKVVKRSSIKISKRTSKTKEKKEISKKKNANTKTIITIVLLAVFAFFLFILIRNLVLTTKVIEKPYLPENCSNDSIKKVWKSVFSGSSNNITIITALSPNESNSSVGIFFIDGCPLYSIYQVNGNNVKALVAVDMWFFLDMNMIYAINADIKPGKVQEAASALSNYSEGYVYILNLSEMGFEGDNENNSLLPRNINTTDEAKSQFESVFKIDSSNWTVEVQVNESEITNATIYTFNESENMENITIFGESIDPMGEIGKSGIVFGNSSLDEYIYTEASMFGMLETLIKRFENWTSPINTSLKNITIQVNNSKLDLLGDYNNVQKIKILQDNETIIESNVDFTDNFDWTKIILKEEDSNSTRGYVIINGLNFTKNITLDRLNNASRYVCIKDKDVNSINEISGSCNAANEYLIKCTSSENLTNATNTTNTSNFTCKILGDKFLVTGLMHSAVVEILPSEENCVASWTCSDWTGSEKQCGYRICTDSNVCNNISNKPIEYKECPVCTPNWECTNFTPEKCPKSKERTRTCTDLNNCGKDGESPETKQTCERKTNWIWIAIALGIGIVILLIILLSKKKDRQPNANPRNPYQNQPGNPPQENYRSDPSYPSNQEQGYSYQETDNYKAPVTQTKSSNDEEYYFPPEA